jgi:hypothetical protein
MPDAPRTEPPWLDLGSRLAALESRVRAAVEVRRRADPDPDDRFRGLYISEIQVDALLRNGTAPGPVSGTRSGITGAEVSSVPASMDAHGRCEELASSFALDDTDLQLLLIVLAPDVEPRFERLYAYLQDDVTRRRPSIGLALELCGLSMWSVDARARLQPGSALVEGGLVLLEDVERPLPSRTLRAPERVSAYLLGSDIPDPGLVRVIVEPVEATLADVDALAAAFGRGVDLIYLRDRVGAAVMSVAAGAFAAGGLATLALDLERLGDDDDPEVTAAIAVREARLQRAGVVAWPVEALSSRRIAALQRLADAPVPVVLSGRSAWETSWSSKVPLLLDAPVLSRAASQKVWRTAALTATDDDRLTAFRLAPEQIERAKRSAMIRAAFSGEEPGLAEFQAGARSENASGLDRLARRVEPRAGWSDLVLPPRVVEQIRELAARARRRDIVIDDWGMGGGATHGRGVTALFAGDPGTGKTMSAEVVTGELGLDLYVIDLSSVVDKYIGETEKNLDRIFNQADRVNGVLLFDEADALFGQRSEVRDARDRYANVEIAYLLQCMEQFDGLAILTTNLRANIDEGFLRRLDAVIDFPMPEEDDRLAIWRLHLPRRVPQADDVDLPFMASRFRLSGGHIRNVCLTAAYLAAERDGCVAMADIVRGTEREYGKLGRLTVEAEFGPYLAMLADGRMVGGTR